MYYDPLILVGDTVAIAPGHDEPRPSVGVVLDASTRLINGRITHLFRTSTDEGVRTFSSGQLIGAVRA